MTRAYATRLRRPAPTCCATCTAAARACATGRWPRRVSTTASACSPSNEVFFGHASHQSARYVLGAGGREERQSSSGLIVTTGTGATGWAASIHLERHSALALPAPGDRRLAFFVREAWPGPATGTTLTEGVVEPPAELTIRNERSDGAVVFGDGIETDRLTVDWAQRVTVGVARDALRLVV